MRTRGTVQPTHMYAAIDDYGNLYIGVTNNPQRRRNEHLRNGRRTIDSRPCPEAIDCEAAAIHFYQIQEFDGESFHVLNQEKKIGRFEIERRWPERI